MLLILLLTFTFSLTPSLTFALTATLTLAAQVVVQVLQTRLHGAAELRLRCCSGLVHTLHESLTLSREGARHSLHSFLQLRLHSRLRVRLHAILHHFLHFHTVCLQHVLRLADALTFSAHE